MNIKETNNKKFNIILIILTILASSFFTGIRAYYTEKTSDDLLYSFKLDNNPLGYNNFQEPIETLSDAIESQKNQYFHSNGRFVVHILVQMFAGPWGKKAWSIFLASLMGGSIILFIYYTVPVNKRLNPIYWILASFCFLYLFQDNSLDWYLICLGMNYLYPIFLTLAFLIFIRISSYWRSNNLFFYFLLSFIGLITGFSQECFSLPLSGALFFYLIYSLFNHHKIDKKIWTLTLSLWIGTICLVIAPGNFVRLEGGKSIFVSLYDGLLFLINTKLIWLLLITVILIGLKRFNFKIISKKNYIDVSAFILSILLGLIANSFPQSFNGVSLFAGILLFKLIAQLEIKSIPRLSLISISLLAVLTVNQIRIIHYTKRFQNIYRQYIEDYQNSTTGIIPEPSMISLPFDVFPFVWNWFNQPTIDWINYTIKVKYGNNNKPLISLKQQDLRYYEEAMQNTLNINFSHPETKYEIGEKYIWISTENFQLNDSIIIVYNIANSKNPLDKLVRLKKMISGKDKLEVIDDTLNISNIHILYNWIDTPQLIGIKISQDRPIEGIKLLKDNS